MIATMMIETALGFYTLLRYKLTPAVRLSAVVLFMLALFQLAEYFVCTGSVGHGIFWSRIGFAAITTLPVLGLHLMHKVANKPVGKLVYTAYASMAAFVVYFLASPNVFDNYQCTGNYVIFRLRPGAGGPYWLFYMGWIGLSMILGGKWANKFMREGKTRKLKAIRGLIVGWLTFLVPTAIANIVSPATRDGIPSVMCGFAVLFALTLALYILPKIAEDNTNLTKMLKRL
jgi:hypothetical protein